MCQITDQEQLTLPLRSRKKTADAMVKRLCGQVAMRFNVLRLYHWWLLSFRGMVFRVVVSGAFVIPLRSGPPHA